MIHVDRSSVPNPFEINERLADRGRKELDRYYELTQSGKLAQQRFPFAIYKDAGIREALINLFHGKCAYCESSIGGTQPGDIEHFRPKTSVVENPDHPGYWWLVNSWDNLLMSCIDCGRTRRHEGEMTGKGNRFPLENEKQRAFQPGDEKNEIPLLLNPTIDFPEEHLIYTEAGNVVSETKKGNTTITVLGFNRPALVQQRVKALQTVTSLMEDLSFALKRLIDSPDDAELADRLNNYLDNLNQHIDAAAEFAQMKRQYIRPFLEKHEPDITGVQRAGFVPVQTEWESSVSKISQHQIHRAEKKTRAYQAEMSDYSLEDEAGIQKYRLQRRTIERIAIRNFRAIKRLDLDLNTLSREGTPWLMLLGENGTGKSTILQALALVLVGGDYFQKLIERRELDPADFIRYRCKSGSVKIQLSGFSKPHELVVFADHVTYTNPTGGKTHLYFGTDGIASVEGESWKPQTVLLGYGATRLLPRKKTGEVFGGDFARVDNLFDPFVPLFDAKQWLLGREQETFDELAIILKDLLSLEPDINLVREKGDVWVKSPNSKVSLKQLSDGYQSMVAMTVDILQVALRLWPKLENAEGIVLLDEIGAHLHPTWKMKVVSTLRKALPGIQFIATTHEPLCLRGLGAREVIVMQRDENKNIVAVSNLPSPSDLRIDQILTSEFFGLNTTIDPGVEKIFDEYYALLALSNPDPEQTARLEMLREQLKDRRYLGNTLRENLMYDAIDRLVARQKTVERQPIAEVKQEAVDQVSKIWLEAVGNA